MMTSIIVEVTWILSHKIPNEILKTVTHKNIISEITENSFPNLRKNSWKFSEVTENTCTEK